MKINKLPIAFCASALACFCASALADMEPLTAKDTAQMVRERDAAKAKAAAMTPEEKAAAKKAKDAEARKNNDTMLKRTQNPQGASANILKSAADSKAGPTPPHGTINTPEADKVLKEQKGQ